MVKLGQNCWTSPSGRREHLAQCSGQPGSCRAPAHRLGRQATGGVASHAVWASLPAFVFAFHGGEEIGPRMLVRIAKHTGLAPEDL